MDQWDRLVPAETLRLEWLEQLEKLWQKRPGEDYFPAQQVWEPIYENHKDRIDGPLADGVLYGLLKDELVTRLLLQGDQIAVRITTKGRDYLMNSRNKVDLDSGAHEHWLRNAITLIVLLAFGLAGFFLFQEARFQAVLWFLFVLVVSPVILAFTQSAHTIKGKNLIELYRVGVAQISGIGKVLNLLGGSKPTAAEPSVTPHDDVRHAKKKSKKGA